MSASVPNFDQASWQSLVDQAESEDTKLILRGLMMVAEEIARASASAPKGVRVGTPSGLGAKPS